MKLTIHAGLHKTGSSSIQVFCDVQKRCLSDAHIYYPTDLCLNGAHHPLAWLLRDRNSDEIASFLDKCLVECEQRGLSQVLVSSEDFEYVDSSGLALLRDCADRFGIDLSAIIYIRPQSDLVVSQYSQQVREGCCFDSLDTFFVDSIKHARFLRVESILDLFSSAFDSSLDVVFYYDSNGVPVNAVRDIAGRLGISNIEGYTDPGSYGFNPKLSRLQLDLIRRIVHEFQPLQALDGYEKSQVLYHFIEAYEWPAFVLRSPKLALTSEQVAFCKVHYSEENARISRKYLGAPDVIERWYSAALSLNVSGCNAPLPSLADLADLGGVVDSARSSLLDLLEVQG